MSLSYEEALRVANNNTQAASFLVDFVAYCHLLDDIVDEPTTINDERLIKETMNLLRHFCLPGWTRDNSPMLFPLIIVAKNAWIDSNRMAESSDDKKRFASDVVKGVYHELIYFVALLCGGHDHMRLVSQSLRDYDYEHHLQMKKEAD